MTMCLAKQKPKCFYMMKLWLQGKESLHTHIFPLKPINYMLEFSQSRPKTRGRDIERDKTKETQTSSKLKTKKVKTQITKVLTHF